MSREYRYLRCLLLCAALVAPSATMANVTPQDDRGQDDSRDRQNNSSKRVYDSAHKDYHNWDYNEDQAWRQYLSDEHKTYHNFSKANRKEQSEYWNQRHQGETQNRHSDGDSRVDSRQEGNHD